MRVYIVTGESGEYSDWSKWIDSVWTDEQKAKDRVTKMTKERCEHDYEVFDIDQEDGEVSCHNCSLKRECKDAWKLIGNYCLKWEKESD